MNVLVIGSGGREHALALGLLKSKDVDDVYVVPGNPGMKKDHIKIASVKEEDLVSFSKKNNISFVVIGPEDPLCNGLGDVLRKEGLKVFGPGKDMARLEGSKAFAKEFMKKYHVATADYKVFTTFDEALKYIEKAEFPLVVKASGLAQGKGVVICNTLEEGKEALKSIMEDGMFKEAGETVVIEEFLTGKETSVLSVYDGHKITTLITAMDHKKIGEGETGLNTGGMGTIAPSPYYTKEVEEDFRKNILEPTLKGFKEEGFKDSACIFFGLMITKKGVKLLEYNMRFGDPETQVVTYLLESDLFSLLYNAELSRDENKSLVDENTIKFKEETALCFIVAANGYPQSYKKGIPLNIKDDKDIQIFYSGVTEDKDKLLSSGGRIFGVTMKGKDKKEIQNSIINYIESLNLEDVVFRKDIGNV